jgi:NTE family protein
VKALVLSGGGFAGGAWMLGFILALRDDGIDLGAADLIVGTSAGARTGAQIATGVLDEGVDLYRRSALPAIAIPATLDQFVAATTRILLSSADRREAARRIANLEPLGSGLVPAADRRNSIAAHLPVDAWPEQRLALCAVDADTGDRVVFECDSGVSLLDAVTASGALPGVFPLMGIDGRRYADGGVHSLYNADVAAGHDVVVVVSPLAVSDHLRRQLATETEALGGATVRVVSADEASVAAIGPNPISAATGAAAVAAGAAQAERERDRLRAVWG